MTPTNPYDCTRPGNLFVGYESLRRTVVEGFLNGHSFAIIGGRRCGKTSFLLQMHKDLLGIRNTRSQFHTLYLDLQEFGDLSVASIFRRIFLGVNGSNPAARWSPSTRGAEYEYFLQSLREHSQTLSQTLGRDWVFVLLIDEIDRAAGASTKDQFFHNLRNLLTVSDLAHRFRVVASGTAALNALTSSGSPLNNLRYKFLGVLDRAAAHTLVQAGFSRTWSHRYESKVFSLTGRHPYMLQGILEKFWPEDQDEINQADFHRAASEFVSEHRDFESMVSSFHAAEHQVYRYLSARSNSTETVQGLCKAVDADGVHDAITVLSYHGLVEIDGPDTVRLAGTMFRDWYETHIPKDVLRTTGGREETISSFTQVFGSMHVGDKYESKGQAGVVGPNATVRDSRFVQSWNQGGSTTNLFELSSELARLRLELSKVAETSEHYRDLAAVSEAELAARQGDGPKALEALSTVGKWCINAAEKLGVGVAVAAIVRAIGL